MTEESAQAYRLQLAREGPQPTPSALWFGAQNFCYSGVKINGQSRFVQAHRHVLVGQLTGLGFTFKTLSGAHTLQFSADSDNLSHQVPHIAHYLLGF